ncbi:hypothetical protein K2E95_19070 [Pseudomonas sp. ERGC3:01]|nr:hypothetical protein [Pseudomonas sp. ERGC3:01]
MSDKFREGSVRGGDKVKIAQDGASKKNSCISTAILTAASASAGKAC